MYIFIDFVSNDEVLSDALPITEMDDVCYVVKTEMVKDEGADEDDPNAPTVVNLVQNFQLSETRFDNKKQYIDYMKGYIGKLKEKIQKEIEIQYPGDAGNKDRIAEKQTKINNFLKNFVLANFNDFQFFVGKSMNMDALILLARYESGDVTPTFYVFKDGVVKEKS